MQQTTNLKTRVGFFLLFGVGVIGMLIILFGEIPGLFKPTYRLTVDFPNASGLLKDSNVYLSGALIGKVTTNPQVIPDTQKVVVSLKIERNVEIRQGAQYSIGDSGLLGDKFVEVKPEFYLPDEEKAPLVKDGEVVEGVASPGLQSMINNAEPLINQANHAADQFDVMVTRLNKDVFSGAGPTDLKASISQFRDMVANANELLDEVNTGQGALGRIIYDKPMGDNLVDFIANLKVHGPVFYHDNPAAKGAAANSAEEDVLRKKYE